MIKSALFQGRCEDVHDKLKTLLHQLDGSEDVTNVKFELSTCWDDSEAPVVKAVSTTVLVIWEEIADAV